MSCATGAQLHACMFKLELQTDADTAHEWQHMSGIITQGQHFAHLVLQTDKAARDSLVCCSPNEVTVHWAVLQLAGGDPVQCPAQGGPISRVGAVGLHTADGFTHKVAQWRLPPTTHCPIPAINKCMNGQRALDHKTPNMSRPQTPIA